MGAWSQTRISKAGLSPQLKKFLLAFDGDYHRLPQLVKVQRVIAYGSLTLSRATISQPHPLLRLMDLQKRGRKNTIAKAAADDYKVMTALDTRGELHI